MSRGPGRAARGCERDFDGVEEGIGEGEGELEGEEGGELR